MAEEINALMVIADQLIQSDPLKQGIWDKTFRPVFQLQRRIWIHRVVISSSSQEAPGLEELRQLLYIGSIFINDSKLETTAIRHLRTEPHGLNKAKSLLANACAELFLSRISIPYYHGEPSAYPFLAPNDADVTFKAKDVWAYLRESSGSLSNSSHNFKKFKRYCSVPVCVALLVKSGLLNQENASRVMKKVYPHGLYVPIVQRGNPSIHPDLGAHLHTLGHPENTFHPAAIVCRGVFSALFTRTRFNSVLVYGGWPWLRQYSRAYAKMIYTVMVLMFAAIENYDMNDMAAIRTLILALAGKLVGSPMDRSRWTVRKSVYPKGPKVTMPARPKAKAIPDNERKSGGDNTSIIHISAAAIYVSDEKSSAKQPGHVVDISP